MCAGLRQQGAGGFNPLPHAEGDLRGLSALPEICMFQSTPSRRGRPHLPRPPSLFYRFNPLPHAEGDTERGVYIMPLHVSIHSLTQRETVVLFRRCGMKCVSIHSLTQRETCLFTAATSLEIVSIHSLTQRETCSCVVS